MSAPELPPDQRLIEAANSYARETAGQGIRQISLTLGDGSKRKLEIPQVVEQWPPSEGWALRGDLAACNGVTFRLSGKSLTIFRELVNAGELGIEATLLKSRVWDGFTDDRTMQNAVSKLRGAIRKALDLADDVEPIEPREDRYRLAAV